MHYVFHFVEEFDRLWKFVFRRNFPMEFPIVMYHLKWIIDNFPKNLRWEEMTVQDRNDSQLFLSLPDEQREESWPKENPNCDTENTLMSLVTE